MRERVSYLPGELRMFGYLSGYKHLKFLCDLRGGFGYDRAVHIAEKIMELDLKRKVRQYSTGMKQKLARPDILNQQRREINPDKH